MELVFELIKQKNEMTWSVPLKYVNPVLQRYDSHLVVDESVDMPTEWQLH